jgi:hypothetical protein
MVFMKKKRDTSVDYGVYYRSNGQPLVRVSWWMAPERGQYAFYGGIYTFSTADAKRWLIIDNMPGSPRWDDHSG